MALRAAIAILVTRDASIADQADRVLRLEDGRLLPANR
jgi:predicted ABC-type transport system involved in lysophospholipase L1 biosynthesis ATPase subunit